MDTVLDKVCTSLQKLINKDGYRMKVVGKATAEELEGQGISGFSMPVVELDLGNDLKGYLWLPIKSRTIFGMKLSLTVSQKVLINDILKFLKEHIKEVSIDCYSVNGENKKDTQNLLYRCGVDNIYSTQLNDECMRMFAIFRGSVDASLSTELPGEQINKVYGYYDEVKEQYRIYFSYINEVTNKVEVSDLYIDKNTGSIHKTKVPDLELCDLELVLACLKMKQQMVSNPEYIKDMITCMTVNLCQCKWEEYNPRLSANTVTREKILTQIDKVKPFIPTGLAMPHLVDFFSVYDREDVCRVQLNIPFKNNESGLVFDFLLPFEDESIKDFEVGKSIEEYEPNTMAELIATIREAMEALNNVSWNSVRDMFHFPISTLQPGIKNHVNIIELVVRNAWVCNNPYVFLSFIYQAMLNQIDLSETDITSTHIIETSVNMENSIGSYLELGLGIGEDLRYHYQRLDLDESQWGELFTYPNITSMNNWTMKCAKNFEELVTKSMNKEDKTFTDKVDFLYRTMVRSS